MKKLLFLIPVALVALNIIAPPLLKDRVLLERLDTASPSHWLVLQVGMSFSVAPVKSNFTVDSSGNIVTDQLSAPQAKPPSEIYLSDNANFYGFPFGFYLQRPGNSTGSQATTYQNGASAWSPLRLGMNLSLILIATVIALWFNRKRRISDEERHKPLHAHIPEKEHKEEVNIPDDIDDLDAPPVHEDPRPDHTNVLHTPSHYQHAQVHEPQSPTQHQPAHQPTHQPQPKSFDITPQQQPHHQHGTDESEYRDRPPERRNYL